MSEQTETTKRKRSSRKKKSAGNGEYAQPVFPLGAILAIDDNNARKLYDDKDIVELAETIAENGLKEPIGLRVLASKDLEWGEVELEAMGIEDAGDAPDHVGVLDYGFRRVYALQHLEEEQPKAFKKHGFDKGIPFVPSQSTDEEAKFDNLIENIIRKDLTPAELAESFHNLRYEDNIAVADISSKVKLSKGYIQGLIKLRKDLCEEAWEAFFNGDITYDVAREVLGAGKDEAEQIKVLKAALRATQNQDGKKKKRGARKAAREASGGTVKPSVKELRAKLEDDYSDPKNHYEQGVANTLEWVLGERKRLPKKAK